VRSDYHPNPYFDDHFHLTDDKLCVGKTLAWGAENNLKGDVKVNCQLLGYALWGKWNKLGAFMQTVGDANFSDYVVSYFIYRENPSLYCNILSIINK